MALFVSPDPLRRRDNLLEADPGEAHPDPRLATISALLGHASVVVTGKVYTHMLRGMDREAIDTHAAALFGPAVSNS